MAPNWRRPRFGATSGDLWDLRFLRERLSEMKLDWNAPSLPKEPTTPKPAPLKVTVDLGEIEVMTNTPIPQ